MAGGGGDGCGDHEHHPVERIDDGMGGCSSCCCCLGLRVGVGVLILAPLTFLVQTLGFQHGLVVAAKGGGVDWDGVG